MAEMSITRCGTSEFWSSISMDFFSLTTYWEETNFIVTASLRGLRSNQVRVQRCNRKLLLIAGGSLSCCWFTQTVHLPENAYVEETVTVIHGGILTVTVPMAVRRRRKKITPASIDGVSGCGRRFLC